MRIGTRWTKRLAEGSGGAASKELFSFCFSLGQCSISKTERRTNCRRQRQEIMSLQRPATVDGV